MFIGQKTLDTWMDQDKIDFDSDVLTIKSDGRSFKLMEAVWFIKVEGDENDKAGLLGTVKTNQQLESIGAERYRDSVICQDIAYKVQEGFMAEILTNEPSVVESIQKSAQMTHQDKPEPMSPIVPKQPSSKPTAGQVPAKPSVSTQEEIKSKKSEKDLSDEELLVRFLLSNTPK